MEIKLGHPYVIYLGSNVSAWEAKVKPSGERVVVPFRNGRKYVTIAFAHSPEVMRIPVRERHKGAADIYVADGIFNAGRKRQRNSWKAVLRIMKSNVTQARKDGRKWPSRDYQAAIKILKMSIQDTTNGEF